MFAKKWIDDQINELSREGVRKYISGEIWKGKEWLPVSCYTQAMGNDTEKNTGSNKAVKRELLVKVQQVIWTDATVRLGPHSLGAEG